MTRWVVGPQTRGGTGTAQHTTVTNEVQTSNLQGVVNKENPTLHEMARNTNPIIQMLFLGWDS